MTLKEWGDLPDDVYAELVNGVLVEDEMTTEIHDGLATFLGALFFSWVQPNGGFVYFERKYGVSRNTGRKPDVSVFLGSTPRVTGSARVTMHVLEGTREQIEAQLRQSIEAFFDFFPEI